jgi:hypothetical protein
MEPPKFQNNIYIGSNLRLKRILKCCSNNNNYNNTNITITTLKVKQGLIVKERLVIAE